ncbi:MAG TPA: glycine--tRNA ligase subunit beta [Bacillales bacterium]|nr:glycine--tRNA ligase subunit beta [Bacillales bacterium]
MSERQPFLLEIGLEEMPAPFVPDAIDQLKNKCAAWFEENELAYGEIRTFSTPRRLTILVTEVPLKQPDREIEARGPAKQIAMDEDGEWSKPAIGFARGQGVDVNDLYVQEVKGKAYVFAKKYIKGERTEALLPGMKTVIQTLSFPRSMRWGTHDFRFIRPIRWMVALFGEQVVPISMTGVESGRRTRGHRFLGEEIELHQPADYEHALLGQYVIADADQRKQAIREQLETLMLEESWHIPIDESLLDEITNLVEYPTVLYGTFDKTFLKLPKEVLLTSMREHQRYFPVEGENGELLPYFVTVRNGDHRHLDQVAKGNEKVLRARLSDAVFFYEEDQKTTIDEALKRLSHIVFQEKLGTMADKTARVRRLANQIAEQLKIAPETQRFVDRAAEICKFDLVTHMVDEFSELQGVIGEQYARLFGEPELVAVAVREHYQPRFKDDALPATDCGAIVAIADKLDTITGCFLAGLIPTGSQDPYALRRHALGIVQILLERKFALSVENLFRLALDVYAETGLFNRKRSEASQQLREFFTTRIRTLLQERTIPYDVVDAVLAGEINQVADLAAKAELLTKKRTTDAFKPLVEALSRVTNIAAKADIADSDEARANPELFAAEQEKALYEAANKVDEQLLEAANNDDPQQAYEALIELQPVIHEYFDNIMVMAEDHQLRENRLKQMVALSRSIRSFADFGAIVL